MSDASTPRSHVVTIDGLRFGYHVAGRGPACVVHPGGPGIHWPYLRMPDLEREMTMVYLAPVGTGESDLLPDGNYSVERYAYFADQVIQQLGDAKVYFLGHSHGGFVALQLALDQPEQLAEWQRTVDLTVDPKRRPDLRDVRDRLAEVDVPTLVVGEPEKFVKTVTDFVALRQATTTANNHGGAA
ncbi:hypothetical protein GCM10009554_27130 [Kribbella koreensis]|uniref:AB hydrolase-1 domain-containing protein n=1 Tax=Kribbella koreensis TaxID=57909 RepID=A0ABP4ALH9_9ACTN